MRVLRFKLDSLRLRFGASRVSHERCRYCRRAATHRVTVTNMETPQIRDVWIMCFKDARRTVTFVADLQAVEVAPLPAFRFELERRIEAAR